MPGINKTNPNRIVAGAGRVSFIEIEMTAAEAVEAFGANVAHVDGFYRAFETSIEDAKKLKRDPGAKIIQNEAGVSRKQLTTKDDAMLEVVSLYGDDATTRLYDIMERRPRRVRGTRPAPDDADGANPAILFGLRNAFKVAGSEREFGTDVVKAAMTIQASRTEDGKPAFDEATVDLSDETDWPANVADFKSDAI